MTTAENRKPGTENPKANLRIFLTGVGGQGTLLASRLLGEAAMAAGYNPMVSETHGMAQRGGIVVSTVVVGDLKSPVISPGEADIVLGFEAMEAFRALDCFHGPLLQALKEKAECPLAAALLRTYLSQRSQGSRRTGGSSGICKVVARFTDARVLKGTIQHFAPNRPLFHLITDGPGVSSVKVPVGALKALFFVKDFAGDPTRKDRNDFPDRPAQARQLIVHFADGEKLAGTTTAFAPGCPGFFVVPADPEANNERVFVVRSAVKRVEWVSGVPSGVAKRLWAASRPT